MDTDIITVIIRFFEGFFAQVTVLVRLLPDYGRALLFIGWITIPFIFVFDHYLFEKKKR